MRSDDNKPIDAGVYKGILPVHMRQGMPPYLQILFASRDPLPYVAPMRKPHKLEIKSCFENLNFKNYFEKIEQNQKMKEEQESQVSGQKVPQAVKYQRKVASWTEKMEKHIHNQKSDYRNWLENTRNNLEGKSKDAYKTLIVSNLVF